MKPWMLVLPVAALVLWAIVSQILAAAEPVKAALT